MAVRRLVMLVGALALVATVFSDRMQSGAKIQPTAQHHQLVVAPPTPSSPAARWRSVLRGCPGSC